MGRVGSAGLSMLRGNVLIGTGLCLPTEYYPYMEELKELEQRDSSPISQDIPPVLTQVSTPLRIEEWARNL